MNLLQMSCVITYAQLVLTDDVMEAFGGQKHPSEAKNGMKELIYWKKCLTKVSQQPQKTPCGSNQIWAMTSGKKDTSSNLRGHCIRLYVAAAATPPAISNIPICRYKIKGCYVPWFKLWPHFKKNTSKWPPRSLKTDISKSRFKPAGFDF